ncbi:MAG: hypothetical protein RIM23_04795 [Coleofasciculus sp. G3-WIS-01]
MSDLWWCCVGARYYRVPTLNGVCAYSVLQVGEVQCDRIHHPIQ